jgi:hypothetical protein
MSLFKGLVIPCVLKLKAQSHVSHGLNEYLLCPRKPYEKVCFAGVSLMSRPIAKNVSCNLG